MERGKSKALKQTPTQWGQSATPISGERGRAMHRYSYVLAALIGLCLPTSAPAQAQDEPFYMVAFASDLKGNIESWRIPCSKMSTLPRWSPPDEEPLVSVGEAINACQRAKMNISPGRTRLPLDRIYLVSNRQVGAPPVWYYRVNFSKHPQVTLEGRVYEAGWQRTCIVLMTGEVLHSTPMTKKEFDSYGGCSDTCREDDAESLAPHAPTPAGNQ